MSRVTPRSDSGILACGATAAGFVHSWACRSATGKTIRVVGIDRAWINVADMRTDEDVQFLKMVANLIGQTVRLHRLVKRDRERILE